MSAELLDVLDAMNDAELGALKDSCEFLDYEPPGIYLTVTGRSSHAGPHFDLAGPLSALVPWLTDESVVLPYGRDSPVTMLNFPRAIRDLIDTYIALRLFS